MHFSYCLYLSILLVTIGWVGTGYTVEKDEVVAVWATPAENRTAILQYASMVNGQWTVPVSLSIQKGLHVTPAIAVDKKRVIWIIWIEQTVDENILRYAIVRPGKIEIGRVGSPDGEESFAPTIIIDDNNVPWIAWSGVTGKLADVYVSRWNGSAWEARRMVNEINDTPDITPILGIQGGKTLWLSWFGFSQTHQFVRHRAQLIDGSWLVDKSTSPSKDVKQFIGRRINTDVLFPVQAENRLMGGIFVGSSHEIQSISDQFISFQTEGNQ